MKIDELRKRKAEIELAIEKLQNEKKEIGVAIRQILQDCDSHKWGKTEAHLRGDLPKHVPHINTWSRTCVKCGAKEVTSSIAEQCRTDPVTGLRTTEEVPSFEAENLIQRW